MKITLSELKKIIKDEVRKSRILKESTVGINNLSDVDLFTQLENLSIAPNTLVQYLAGRDGIMFGYEDAKSLTTIINYLLKQNKDNTIKLVIGMNLVVEIIKIDNDIFAAKENLNNCITFYLGTKEYLQKNLNK
jgi:hypothetical protein